MITGTANFTNLSELPMGLSLVMDASPILKYRTLSNHTIFLRVDQDVYNLAQRAMGRDALNYGGFI